MEESELEPGLVADLPLDANLQLISSEAPPEPADAVGGNDQVGRDSTDSTGVLPILAPAEPIDSAVGDIGQMRRDSIDSPELRIAPSQLTHELLARDGQVRRDSTDSAEFQIAPAEPTETDSRDDPARQDSIYSGEFRLGPGAGCGQARRDSINSTELPIAPILVPAELAIAGALHSPGRRDSSNSTQLPMAPAEIIDAVAGDGQVCRQAIKATLGAIESDRMLDHGKDASTQKSSTSHRRSDYNGNGSSSNSSSVEDLSFPYVDPFIDPSATPHKSLAAANKSPTIEAHESGNLPLKVTLQLAFQAIGVVFGDLGASPLLVYDSAFGLDAELPSEEKLLGALSMIIYTITLLPLIKYVVIVLRANDHGNGETFALYSLICRSARIKVATYQIPEDRRPHSYNWLKGLSKNPKGYVILSEKVKEMLQTSKVFQDILLILALFGTCAYIGDGVLTPAISVLWAMSGIKTKFPSTSDDTLTYSSVGILVVFFCIQRFGTDKGSFMFSPILLVWFLSIFAIGAYNIHFYPAVFKAFNPYYIYLFFERNKKDGWVSLAGTVLAITGSESVVTDMGHFSVASIQIAFSTVVYPSLIVAYVGQAAYLIHNPSAIGATFYKSIPSSLFWPMFALANATAIIASQGMISSTFNIIEQCMALGCFPRCKVVHLSKKFQEQIYIPEVNWILMLLTVGVTIGFKTTGQIGNAYGLAVVSVMLVTTAFLTLIMVMVWQRSLWIAGAFLMVFMAFETVFASSLLYKVPEGGWVPVIFVAVVYSMMYIWHYGRKYRYIYEIQHKISMDWVLDLGSSLRATRVKGVAFVYSELADGVPTIFAHLTKNLKAMHSLLVFVCIKHLPMAHVLEEERLVVRRLGPKQYHMYRIAVRYGYADQIGVDADFETKLIDSLVAYVAAEERIDGTDDSESTSEIESSDTLINTKEVSFESDNADVSVVLPEIPRETVSGQSTIQSTGDLAMLEESRRNGVVYFVGRTHIRAAEGSSAFRRFIIDIAYNFLRKNCRSQSVGLNVPPSRIVQIGMLQHI